jgi:heptosyltransferase-2
MEGRSTMSTIINALVIEMAFPGDVVISLALPAELKRLAPDARVTYLTRPDAADLAHASLDVDDVIVFDKRGSDSGMAGIERIAGQLNERSFTHLFLLHSSKRSIELAKRLNIAPKIGFASDAELKHRVDEPAFGTARTARAISLLDPIFNDVSKSTLPRLQHHVSEFSEAIADNTIALAPGSVWATKKWGDDKFVELARLLLKADLHIAVIGGPTEREVGERIKAIDPTRVFNLAGKTTLVQAAGVIAKCRLLIGNDSAPIHLATAVNTPSVVVYGPTVKEFGFAPPQEMSRVVEAEGLWCRPCTPHGSDVCPIFTHKCMKTISATEVAKIAFMFFIFREKIVGG